MGIILLSDLNWMDQLNYRVQKALKAIHFVMRVVKKGNRNTQILAYTSLVRPIHEYGFYVGAMQRRTDKYARPGTAESCSIF